MPAVPMAQSGKSRFYELVQCVCEEYEILYQQQGAAPTGLLALPGPPHRSAPGAFRMSFLESCSCPSSAPPDRLIPLQPPPPWVPLGGPDRISDQTFAMRPPPSTIQPVKSSEVTPSTEPTSRPFEEKLEPAGTFVVSDKLRVEATEKLCSEDAQQQALKVVSQEQSCNSLSASDISTSGGEQKMRTAERPRPILVVEEAEEQYPESPNKDADDEAKGPVEWPQEFSSAFANHNATASDEMKQKRAAKDFCKHPVKFLKNSDTDFMVRTFMNFALVTNIIVIGVEADSDWIGWLYVGAFYGLVFSLEVLRRFYLEGLKTVKPGEKDALWHVFDIALAGMQVAEVVMGFMALHSDAGGSGGNFTWLRSVRLVRICRILRLLELDIFSDLILMVNGAVGGLQTLGWSVLLLCLPVYVFALFMQSTVGQYEATDEFDVCEHFSTVGRAMFTGYRCLIVGDCSSMSGTPIFPHIVATRENGWLFGLAYCATSVCMTFGLFNVIVAIYVENTVSAAKTNQGLQRQRRLANVDQFASQIVSMSHFLWNQKNPNAPFEMETAMSMDVDRDFFRGLVDNSEMHILLSNLDVPREDHLDLFDICDADGSGSVSIDELMGGIKRLRGDPRRSDIVFVMLRAESMQNQMASMVGEMAQVKKNSKAIRGIKEDLMLIHDHLQDLKAR